MTYPATKSDLVNGISEMDANQINNIEDYVGITADVDTSTLTYKLTNPAQVSPGHKHAAGDMSGGDNGTMFFKDPADGLWKAWLPDTIGLVTKSGEQTIANKKTFTTIPEGPDASPTTQNQLARKKYIDDLLANYVLPKYGAMSKYANTTPLGIIEADNPMLARYLLTGLVSGFTFNAGSTGAITAFTDGTGTTIVTSVGHGLLVGSSMYVSIKGTTNYNGLWYVSITDIDSFVLPTAFVANDATGDWVVGSYLKAGVGSAGVYKLDCKVLASFEVPSVGTVHLIIGNTIVAERVYSEAYYEFSDLYTIADNDIITIAVENINTGQDIVLINTYLNLIRIGNV